MNIEKELLLSILAMDSYNREYGAGIDIGGKDLGLVKFDDHVVSGITTEEYGAWQAAGFYAASYNTEYGTVISYRGTDDPLGSKSGSDIWEGWVRWLISIIVTAHTRAILGLPRTLYNKG